MNAGGPGGPYLLWLYRQVRTVRTTRKGPNTYWDLFGQLCQTEFVWFVPNDDNRASDGRELRYEWAARTGTEVTSEWLEVGCSFLEMLIGVARRLSFEGGNDSASWFWQLIDNLGLTEYKDGTNFEPEEVEDITSAVIWRTYDRDGNGGLFPLRRASKDQRRVEIWYQLSEYLLQDS